MKFVNVDDEMLQLQFCGWISAQDIHLIDLDPYSNEYLVAKINFDTAGNEPRKVWITNLSDHIPNVL